MLTNNKCKSLKGFRIGVLFCGNQQALTIWNKFIASQKMFRRFTAHRYPWFGISLNYNFKILHDMNRLTFSGDVHYLTGLARSTACFTATCWVMTWVKTRSSIWTSICKISTTRKVLWKQPRSFTVAIDMLMMLDLGTKNSATNKSDDGMMMMIMLLMLLMMMMIVMMMMMIKMIKMMMIMLLLLMLLIMMMVVMMIMLLMLLMLLMMKMIVMMLMVVMVWWWWWWW